MTIIKSERPHGFCSAAHHGFRCTWLIYMQYQDLSSRCHYFYSIKRFRKFLFITSILLTKWSKLHTVYSRIYWHVYNKCVSPFPRCCHSHVDEWSVQHSDHRRRGQADDLLEAAELKKCLCTVCKRERLRGGRYPPASSGWRGCLHIERKFPIAVFVHDI